MQNEITRNPKCTIINVRIHGGKERKGGSRGAGEIINLHGGGG